MSAALTIEHFTDPGCPWAYSASPALAALHWRYDDQLEWSLTTIGLTESAKQYEDRGYTPTRSAVGNLRFRERFGMPFALQPRARVSHTGLACRAIVATRLLTPEYEYRAFRALQWAQFTTPVLFDTEDGIRQALDTITNIDTETIVASLGSDAVESAYQADRARARSAEGGPTHFQGKSANSDGQERFTAPSLVISRVDPDPTRPTSLEVGGFQPLEAYDVCIANLDPTLSRRGPAEDPVEALGVFDYALCTAEVAEIMAPSLTPPDLLAAEAALIAAAAEGRVVRQQLGDSALWHLAGRDSVPGALTHRAHAAA